MLLSSIIHGMSSLFTNTIHRVNIDLPKPVQKWVVLSPEWIILFQETQYSIWSSLGQDNTWQIVHEQNISNAKTQVSLLKQLLLVSTPDTIYAHTIKQEPKSPTTSETHVHIEKSIAISLSKKTPDDDSSDKQRAATHSTTPSQPSDQPTTLLGRLQSKIAAGYTPCIIQTDQFLLVLNQNLYNLINNTFFLLPASFSIPKGSFVKETTLFYPEKRSIMQYDLQNCVLKSDSRTSSIANTAFPIDSLRPLHIFMPYKLPELQGIWITGKGGETSVWWETTKRLVDVITPLTPFPRLTMPLTLTEKHLFYCTTPTPNEKKSSRPINEADKKTVSHAHSQTTDTPPKNGSWKFDVPIELRKIDRCDDRITRPEFVYGDGLTALINGSNSELYVLNPRQSIISRKPDKLDSICFYPYDSDEEDI